MNRDTRIKSYAVITVLAVGMMVGSAVSANAQASLTNAVSQDTGVMSLAVGTYLIGYCPYEYMVDGKTFCA